MKKSHPDRFILNGAFDPRDGAKGLEYLHANCEKYQLKGVKLYTAEWRGESKGYKLTDKDAYKFLESAQKLGINNIHVHKGPTIIPLNRDAFDVADIDDVATRSRISTSSSSIAACRALTISAGSPRRRPMSMAALRWRCPSSTRVRAISPMSSGNCCSGLGRTRSCSAATTASGRRTG